MKTTRTKLKRMLLAPFIWLAATIFLIEEFIWDWTAAKMSGLGAMRAVHAVERYIAALPPRWALFAFLLPGSILIPAKLFGLQAIASGHWLLGSVIFMLAKLTGMALFSRIFNLTRPTLMQLYQFARFYAWVMYFRNRIHAYLNGCKSYQHIKLRLRTLISSVKRKLAAVLDRGRK